MNAHKITRFISGIIFALTALMWLNMTIQPSGYAYIAAVGMTVLALISHGVEKGVKKIQSK